MINQSARIYEDTGRSTERFDVLERIKALLEASQKPITTSEVSLLVRSLEEQVIALPFPGRGHSFLRWQSLAAFGAFDLNVGKLLESHFDALAIMSEANYEPQSGLYGVWASKFEGKHLKAKQEGDVWHITGEVAFASGIDSIEYALVPVATEDGEQLFDLPKSAIRSKDMKRWNTPGMFQSDTAWITVDCRLPMSSKVGGLGFYLNRKGFWPGAIGVAACWLGGAQAIFSNWYAHAKTKTYADPHEQAAIGQAYASLSACFLYLKSLAKIVDDPSSSLEVLQREALTFRHLVDKASSDLLTTSQKASGPVLLIKDAEHSKRFLDLQIFLRQCHAEKDLVNLTKSLEQSDFKGEWF